MSDSICVICKRVNLSALKAAHTGHLQCLQAAFVDNPNKSCAGDSKGATALHLSARAGHAECLDWLLKNSGMDPKCKVSDALKGGVTGRLLGGASPTSLRSSILSVILECQINVYPRDVQILGDCGPRRLSLDVVYSSTHVSY